MSRARCWLALAVAVTTPTPAVATTLYVGGTEPGAYSDVQSALDAAEEGDEILVAQGTFTGPIDFLGKDLVLAGAGIGLTRLDVGCDEYVYLDGLSPAAVIRDFAFFADCPGELVGPVLYGEVDSNPTIARVAVLGAQQGPVCDLRGPLAPTDLEGSIEDLFVEQLSGDCPGHAGLGIRSLHGSARRLLVMGRCGGYLNLLVGPVTVENALIQDSDDLAVLAGDATVALAHLTVVQSPPTVSSTQHGLNLDSNDMSAVRSSVFAGAEDVGISVSCPGGFADPWDLQWTDNWPAAGGTLADEDDPWPCEVPYPYLYPLGEDGNISEDPLFIDWTPDGDPTNDDLCPAPGSPLIDAGDPDELDPDGSRADIGAFGGPHAFTCDEVLDADGDGYRPVTGDCDDSDPDRFPFQSEVACDGIDQDCDGEDDLNCPDDDDSGDDDDDNSAGDDDSGDDDDDDDSAGDDDDDAGGDDDSSSPGDPDCSEGCPNGCGSEPGDSTAVSLLAVLLPVAARRRRSL